MTRAEHLKWCKKIARVYFDHRDLQEACTSFLSDMGKHGDLRDHLTLMMVMLIPTWGGNIQEAHRFIEDFN